VLIIAAIFMKLRERGPLIIAFAVAGLFLDRDIDQPRRFPPQ